MEEIYDRLDSILLEYGNEDGHSILGISELDGFIHALACAPEVVVPSVWLPAIWGGQRYAPAWPTMEQAQSFHTDVIAVYNDALNTLHAGECEPVFNYHEIKGKTYFIADEWCEGFKRGMLLWGPRVHALDPQGELLKPILIFTLDSTGPHKIRTQMNDAQIDEMQQRIPACVLAIRQFYGVSQGSAPAKKYPDGHKASVVKLEPKTGRNDMCSCGSGKKYKKCCGV